jgi:iron complex transport system substrate-binding protein
MNTDGKPQRVVSLLGAATETLYRLGLGDQLVGRSHECDYPKACLALPCISRPRLDVNASSIDIDRAVKSRSAEGEPIYRLDDDVIADLKPDLLIAQDHCRVCAVTPRDVEQSACSNVAQLVLRPATLSDCLGDVEKIASAMGVPERGVALRATLEGRLDRVRHIVGTETKTKPTVALLEWCDPIMGCGYWLPELVEIAGGTPLHCPPPGGATPTISFQTLIQSKPDVVVFALCGFGLSRAAMEIASSWGQEKIQQLKDACGDNVYVVDGNYLMNRSGPRLVESCEALAEVIHHEQLLGHFGHFGTDLLTSLGQAILMADAGEKTGSAKERPPPLREDASAPNEIVRPTINPADAVQAQLKCLHAGDITKAFAMNSAANQDRWCGPERFMGVLQGSEDFCRLLTEPASVGAVEEKGSVATVRVSLPEREGTPGAELLWTVIAEVSAGGNDVAWRTEKVGMAF